MKTAVIGSRTYNDYGHIEKILKELPITHIVSGGSYGVDALAEWYATTYNIPYTVIPAEWSEHGKAAGPIRNTKIIESAELVVAFWDMRSPGTKDSINKARKLNKQLLVINISQIP